MGKPRVMTEWQASFPSPTPDLILDMHFIGRPNHVKLVVVWTSPVEGETRKYNASAGITTALAGEVAIEIERQYLRMTGYRKLEIDREALKQDLTKKLETHLAKFSEGGRDA